MNTQLLKDLAELENQGIITTDTAEKIKGYYHLKQQSSPNKTGIIIGVLGALLAGSGLILIIAHNWEVFGKLTQTILGLLPLFAAQLLATFTLAKRKDHRGWRECSAVLLFLAIPTSISVISQVYQIEGSLKGFLLTWTLLALPITYVLSSAVVPLLCIATATWYAASSGYFERPVERPYLYLAMIGFLIPHYYRLLINKGRSTLMFITNFLLCISITITLGTFIQGDDDWYPWFFALYLSLFCVFYMVGSVISASGNLMKKHPFHITGAAGILIILFIWSFNELWDSLSRQTLRGLFYNPLPYLLIAGILLLLFLFYRARLLNVDWTNQLMGCSMFVFLLATISFYRYPSFGILVANCWILILAVVYIRRGSRENHFGLLNFGLIILAVLALCRFFDDSIPFVWRGIFFLITGISFFVSNYLLLNRRKASPKS